MAHVRQELALGPAGGFCCLLRLLHGFFRTLPGGNVLVNDQAAHHSFRELPGQLRVEPRIRKRQIALASAQQNKRSRPRPSHRTVQDGTAVALGVQGLTLECPRRWCRPDWWIPYVDAFPKKNSRG